MAVVAQKVRKVQQDKQKRAEESQRKRTQELFRRCNSAGDGAMSADDVRVLLTELNGGTPPTDTELTFVMRSASKRGLHHLDEAEFVEAINVWECYLEEFRSPDSVGNILFKKHDVDKSGKLSREQLRGLLQELNDDHEVSHLDVDWVIAQSNILGDGNIHKIELSQAIAAWFERKARNRTMQMPSETPKSAACMLL